MSANDLYTIRNSNDNSSYYVKKQVDSLMRSSFDLFP